MQVEAVLEDGVVFEAVGTRIGFDVSLDRNENRLIYVKEECRDDDLEAPVLLHVFPVDPADLPEHRRQSAFDNLDFDFNRYGFLLDRQCIAMHCLPDYRIVRTRTGQFTAEG